MNILRWKEDFIHLLFPDTCGACQNVLETNEDTICLSCMLDLPKTNYHLSPQENDLAVRFWGKVRLRYALAYLKYYKLGTVQTLLHQLKYDGKEKIGELLGLWYGAELYKAGFGEAFDVIIPVPLHPNKFKTRGYNQSEVFGKGLAQSMQVACDADVLLRTRHTETQTQKSKIERWLNVASVFELKNAEKIKDKNILLVDDVITTGSTLEACIHTLQVACPQSISIATIAAAQYG